VSASRLLAIETSCDETAAAVVADGRHILSNVVSTQIAFHAPFGGVVPELASRHHLENICPVIARAMADARIEYADLDAVAVTQGPGLVGSLLVGLEAAKAIAWIHGKPLIPVHHIAGHIEAPFLAHETVELPAVALIVSGGHTSLFEVAARGDYRLLARTRDDAAGEAFDKVAKLLGLGYPGGPVIDRLAEGANDRAHEFTIAKPKDGSGDFSFSGIKTAVSLHVRRAGALDAGQVADIAASFQATVVKTLVRKTVRAARDLGIDRIVLTGGVAANTALREALAGECAERGWHLHIPSRRLCTDNAAMIAAAARHTRSLPYPDYLALDVYATGESGL
jgi:tRNA N6-adenosine threonylcarbamoyltransferase